MLCTNSLLLTPRKLAGEVCGVHNLTLVSFLAQGYSHTVISCFLGHEDLITEFGHLLQSKEYGDLYPFSFSL